MESQLSKADVRFAINNVEKAQRNLAKALDRLLETDPEGRGELFLALDAVDVDLNDWLAKAIWTRGNLET